MLSHQGTQEGTALPASLRGCTLCLFPTRRQRLNGVDFRLRVVSFCRCIVGFHFDTV